MTKKNLASLRIVQIPAGMSNAEAQKIIRDLNPEEIHNEDEDFPLPHLNFFEIHVKGDAPDDAKASFILQQQSTFGFLEDKA